MSIEFGFPPALALLTPRTGGSKSVVQIYRCPKGHLSEIVWTADRVDLATHEHGLALYCPQCDEERAASPAEATSILAALGLHPA